MGLNMTCSSTRCCAPWEVNTDDWWQHHPGWEPSLANDTHTCFDAILDVPKGKLRFMHNLHNNQWNGNCSNVLARMVVNSGFAATVHPFLKAIAAAYEAKRPFEFSHRVEDFIWRYANNNNTPVCKQASLYCYFLPLSPCKTEYKQQDGFDFNIMRWEADHRQWAYKYITRQQHWVRRKVYEILKSHKLDRPCTALHVRRTDAILEGNWRKRRHYFPISDYAEYVNTRNVLLLTDDQSAIDEAHEFYPNRTWVYLNRTRHYGATAGINAHIPSGDPALEVVYILAEFALVSKCRMLVHGRSGMVNLFVLEMGEDKKRIRIDVGRQPNSTHSQTEEEFFLQLNSSRAAKQKTEKPSGK